MMSLKRKALVLVALALSTAAAGAQAVSEVWVDRFDGLAHMNDYGEAIAVDAAGDVYVVGFTFEQVQSNLFAPRILTRKLDPAGNELWKRTFASGFTGGTGAGYHVAVVSGGVVVSGSSDGSQAFATLRYDSAGNLLWSDVHDTGSSYLTQPNDMALDGAGNIYLAGDTNDEAIVLKYDPAGNLQWDVRFTGPDGESGASALAVDDQGNVYVAGYTLVAGAAGELSLLKLNSGGGVVWLQTYGQPGVVTYDVAYDVELDDAGDVWVAGVVGINTAAGTDGALLKYDAAGNLLWDELYTGMGRSDRATQLELWPGGGAAVLLASQDSSGMYQAVLARYDSAGQMLWDLRYSAGSQQTATGYALAVDGTGGVFAAGGGVPLGQGPSYFTVKVDSAGGLVWEQFYEGPLGGESRASALALDDGIVYVTGESIDNQADNEYDIVTIRYDDATAAAYCTAKVTSQGCVPAIGWSGVASASSGLPFLVTADEVSSNKNGMLFYGYGAASIPFQDGTLCVAPPLRRTPVQNSGGNPPPTDCSGTFSLDFNARIRSGVDPSLNVGDTVFAQHWFREPGSPSPTGLTDGISFLIHP